MHMATFWEEPEQVQRFAEKEPDHRLSELLGAFSEPGQTHVLDLGCASGRNTVLLAEAGFDFYAVDNSAPMIEKTRERVAAIVGEGRATDRVRFGAMEDLGEFADGFFHLIVALGVYHQARSPDQWERALGEAQRVLAPGGLLLFAGFSPASQPLGEPLRSVLGQTHMYDGFQSGPLHLVNASDLDRILTSYGLVPETRTKTVEVQTDEGFRVTVNGLYRRSVA